MGGTDKNSNIKLQPGGNGKIKECVSEATISKLLDDFNCASLVISTKTPEAKDEKPSSSSLEDPHPLYQEMVSSLKHLHIKRPVNQRSRRKEKKNLERRAKAISTNKYNLSVAAVNAQRPVVWPAKFNCTGSMSKKTDSLILHPPRLTISGKNISSCASLCACPFSTSLHGSSAEEKSRIAAHLNKQSLSAFDDLTKHSSSQMSFSQLCKQNSSLDGKAGSISSHEHSFSHQSPSTNSKSSSFRGQSCTSANHQQNITFRPSGHNQLSNQVLSFSDYQSRSALAGPDGHVHQDLVSVHSSEKCSGGDSTSSNCLVHSDGDGLTSVLQSTTSCVSQSSDADAGLAPERSCSEEVRMEESNVNELASYFEDLLHIPRKMSVMAEMMYA